MSAECIPVRRIATTLCFVPAGATVDNLLLDRNLLKHAGLENGQQKTGRCRLIYNPVRLGIEGDVMRVVLCFLFAMVAAPAWAEWVKLGETVNSVFYIDPTMIRKNGDIRRVWQIQDQTQGDDTGIMSRRVLKEYDCKEKRYRLLQLSNHSEPLAGGKVLLSFDEPAKEWEAIPPNTPAELVLKIVCAK